MAARRALRRRHLDADDLTYAEHARSGRRHLAQRVCRWRRWDDLALRSDLRDLEAKILAFIDEWNEIAHPFDWTAKSFEKVLNRVDDPWIRRRPHWSDALKAAA